MHTENAFFWKDRKPPAWCCQSSAPLTQIYVNMLICRLNVPHLLLCSSPISPGWRLLTLPFPAPCLSLFLHPGDFHLQQTPAWPWQTWSGSSPHTLLVQTQAAAKGATSGLVSEREVVCQEITLSLDFKEFSSNTDPCPKCRRTVENQEIDSSIYRLQRPHQTQPQRLLDQSIGQRFW